MVNPNPNPMLCLSLQNPPKVQLNSNTTVFVCSPLHSFVIIIIDTSGNESYYTNAHLMIQDNR